MKNQSSFRCLTVLTMVGVCVVSSVSCMTTYDGYGRPVQSVDPGLAVAGVAAAGLVGYAAANNNNHNRNYNTSVRYETYRSYDDYGHGGYDGGYGGGGYGGGYYSSYGGHCY